MSKNNSILGGQCESTNTREKREQKTGKKNKERKRLMDFVWCWNSGHFERGKR